MASFDPTSQEDMQRLKKCIRETRQKLRKYYDNREVIIDALHDPCHATEPVPADERMPHNPLDRMFRIVTRSVVSQNPTLRIARTKNQRRSGMIKGQLVKWANSVDLASGLQALFHEALIRWGWMYTGFDVPEYGNGMEPWAIPLDFDDCFIDQRGNEENEIDFEGHCYAKRLSDLQNNPAYDQNVVDRLSEQSTYSFGKHRGSTLYKWVSLKCVYLPQENVELTLVGDDDKSVGGTFNEPLRIKPYTGPPGGPYIKLRLGEVRGTMVPISRASMLYDLHQFISVAYTQVYVQADDALEFYGYSGESEKDAEKHRTAQHGEYVRFDNPQGIIKFKKGGVDQQSLATAIHADNLFDSAAGNLKLLGGLGPSAPTARQESGLGAGVQGMVDDARQRMDKVTKRIFEMAAWYITRDPLRNEEVEWTTPSGQKQVSRWTPQVGMTTDPSDPEMEIIPGSMVNRSAEEQLASLVQAVERVGRTMSLPGEQPPVFKHRRYRELEAEYGNRPELAELFGEAPDPRAVVPGAEGAAQFGQGGGSRSPAPAGQPGMDKMVERMIFSGGQPAQPNAQPVMQ